MSEQHSVRVMDYVSDDDAPAVTGLDDLLGGQPQPRRTGCVVCGATTAAYVGCSIQAPGRHGKSRGTRVSLCEQHALELWNELVACVEVRRL